MCVGVCVCVSKREGGKRGEQKCVSEKERERESQQRRERGTEEREGRKESLLIKRFAKFCSALALFHTRTNTHTRTHSDTQKQKAEVESAQGVSAVVVGYGTGL